MLRDLNLKQAYTSEEDDLINNFYTPALESAVKYDRVAGYFSTSTFAVNARGMASFVRKNGKMRLITSVELKEDVISALDQKKDYYSLFERLINLDQLTQKIQKNYYKLFAYLLAEQKIEIKVALVPEGRGIFHQKFGILTDENNDSISFSGSINETAYAWSYNSEEFKVFSSWDETADYYKVDRDKFDRYWKGENLSTGIKLVTLPDAVEKQLVRVAEIDGYNIQEIIDEIEQSEKKTETSSLNKDEYLRNYQQEAISAWVQNDYQGIFDMATGTGKTRTALAAVRQLYEEKEATFCVIAVPLTHLIEQWEHNVENEFPEAKLLKASGEYPNWRNKLPEILRSYNNGILKQILVLTTYTTLKSNDFKEMMQYYKDKYCILADEVHNAKPPKVRSAINQIYEYKLGLSATPVSRWDEDSSQELLEVFNNIVYKYSLSDAIRDNWLAPYKYHPITVQLDTDEFENYAELSKKISRVLNPEGESFKDAADALLSQRARIIKNAGQKNHVFENLVSDLKKDHAHQNMLVYCDNQDQIEQIQTILNNNGITTSKVTFKENMQVRKDIFKNFQNNHIDSLVARKCLDEGVDMPSINTAVILASNTDSREYIQRLGRVLRTHPGKENATIYDFLVLPPESLTSNEISSTAANLVSRELERYTFFRDNAVNKEELETFKDGLVEKYRLNEVTEYG